MQNSKEKMRYMHACMHACMYTCIWLLYAVFLNHGAWKRKFWGAGREAGAVATCISGLPAVYCPKLSDTEKRKCILARVEWLQVISCSYAQTNVTLTILGVLVFIVIYMDIPLGYCPEKKKSKIMIVPPWRMCQQTLWQVCCMHACIIIHVRIEIDNIGLKCQLHNYRA